MTNKKRRYCVPRFEVIQCNTSVLLEASNEPYNNMCDHECGLWHLCLDREKTWGKVCYDKRKKQ